MKSRLLLLILGILLSKNIIYGQISQYSYVINPFSDCYVLDSAYFKATYSLSYLLDSTKIDERYEDRKILLIGNKMQHFYSYYNFLNDSAATVLNSQNRNYGSLNFSDDVLYEAYEIYQDLQKNERSVVEYITNYSCYRYFESVETQQWVIHEDTAQILTFNCQKATCRFRGRNWIAWFSCEIPLNAGPWKLCGLPGLIMKAYDEKENYVFECIGLKQMKNNKQAITSRKYYDKLNNTREEYLTAQRNFYENYVNTILSMGLNVMIYDDNGQSIEELETPNKIFENKNISIVYPVYYKDRYRKIPYNPIEL